MKKGLFLRIIFAAISLALILGTSVLPVFANSAQSWFEGVDSSGAIMTDKESPIIVERELLTFDISEFPESYYGASEEYLSYSAKVTAEYTFYNPSEYTVTAKLLFPFGKVPSYASGYYDDDGVYTPFSDTEKYGVTINGETAATKIRHTLSYMYSQFELDHDLSLIKDGFAEDDFYSPDMTVTKYTFRVNSVDTDSYGGGLSVGFDVPKGLGDYRFFFAEQDGFHTQADGDARISTGVRKSGYKLELFVFGTPLVEMPEWHAYRDGGVEDADELSCDVEIVSTETTTFGEFALANRSENSSVSESDWYNAFLADIKNSAERTSEHPIVYCERYNDSFIEQMMRWYEYEITLEPGERMVNAVTAPMYPAIDLDYEPDIYEYTYLLSPAKTWKSFGELEIVINTPYYITECNQDGFEKTENGYSLKLDGLPDDELKFTLSTSENPKREISPYSFIFFALMALAVIVPVLILVIIIVIIVAIFKKIFR